MIDPIPALAELLTKDAVHHNIGLTSSGTTKMRAQRYFAARDALGIFGYDTAEEAETKIRKKFSTV